MRALPESKCHENTQINNILKKREAGTGRASLKSISLVRSKIKRNHKNLTAKLRIIILICKKKREKIIFYQKNLQ